MLRGFLSGVIWGVIFSVGSLWIVSQLGGMIRLFSAPAEIAVTAPAGVSGDVSAGTVEAPAAGGDGPAAGGGQGAMALGQAAPDAPPSADRAGAARPQAGAVGDLAEAPVAEAPAAVNAGGDAAPQPAEAARLAAPSGDSAPDTLQPPEPGQAALQVNAPAGDTSAGDAGEQPAGETAPEMAGTPAEGPRSPGGDNAPHVDFTSPQVVELPDELLDQTQEQPLPDQDPPRTVAQTEPAPDYGDAASVVVNRLPSVGGDTPPVAEEAPADVLPEDDDLADLPALMRYARAFENPQGRPLMAIVLLTGADGQLMQGNGNLPVPVSYAIDASDAAAAELAAKARAAGQEVLAVAPLATGASASEVETALGVYLPRVRQAVALMDSKQIAFQSGRETAGQVIAAARAEGLGVVTYPSGLNQAMQVAEREGVQAGLVFRIFDEGGKDRAAIKRFLDQAAFRAGQGEGVIMLGHDRPETVAAILEWILGNRASTITLAPVSAVLAGG